MTGQITKRQHQVPQFYIKLWAGTSNEVYLYDLQEHKVKLTGSKGILFGNGNPKLTHRGNRNLTHLFGYGWV